MDAEREAAYKSLRAAAHRLLCDTVEGRGSRVSVRSGKLDALDRALKRADDLEKEADGQVASQQTVR